MTGRKQKNQEGTNQSATQQTNQRINQPTNQPTNQPNTNYQSNRTTDRPINQPTTNERRRRPLACFPMHLLPTNFFEMRMGSQLRSLLRNVLSVVPSVKGNNPLLNSWIRRLAYSSSCERHIPGRRRCGLCFAASALAG